MDLIRTINLESLLLTCLSKFKWFSWTILPWRWIYNFCFHHWTRSFFSSTVTISEKITIYIYTIQQLYVISMYTKTKTYVTQCAIPCSTVSWFIKRRSNFQTFIYLSLNDSIYKLSFISHFELWKTDTVGMSNWPTISRNSKIIPDQ